MQLVTKNITRERLKQILHIVVPISKNSQHKTKLAFWATKWLEKNAEVVREQERKEKEITEDLILKHQLFCIDKASKTPEGELKIVGNEYIHTPEAKKEILEHQSKLQSEIATMIEPFLSETVQVQTFNASLDLPASMDYYTENILNGVVFNNINAFEDEFSEAK